MEIKAHAKFIRMSPRRIRLVANLVRGLSVDRAEGQLHVVPRHATVPLLKLLHSAVANAEQNFDCMRENLYVKTLIVNEAPMLKRSRPRAFGRATPIRKRGAHLSIVLAEREEGKRGGRVRRETARGAAKRHTHAASHAHPENEQKSMHEAHTPQVTTPGRVAARHHVEGAKANVHGPQKKSKGFLKRLFNRKSG